MALYAGPERRRYKRIVKNFMANLRIGNGIDDRQEGWNMVTLRNLGGGGALFSYDKRVEVDSIVDMKIKFPASASPIAALGKVVRIERPHGTSVFGVAAMFLDIDEAAREMIVRMADEFYSRKGMKERS